MANKYVSWVSDEHFLDCVRYVCTAYTDPKLFSDKRLHKNTVDPVKLLFDLSNMGLKFDEWVAAERIRQAGKTVNNRIGEFHKKLLGGVKGWKDLGVGDDSKIDLVREDNSIFIELKNKYNTTNSDSLEAVRIKLEHVIGVHPKATAYWAFIISRSGDSGEAVWHKKGHESKKSIRKVWGANVYELVTGKEDSLQEMWFALPAALADITGKQISSSEEKKLQEFFERAFS